jgi:hypothetical protein
MCENERITRTPCSLTASFFSETTRWIPIEISLGIYSKIYACLIEACHSIEVSVSDAVFVVVGTWILEEREEGKKELYVQFSMLIIL